MRRDEKEEVQSATTNPEACPQPVRLQDLTRELILLSGSLLFRVLSLDPRRKKQELLPARERLLSQVEPVEGRATSYIRKVRLCFFWAAGFCLVSALAEARLFFSYLLN